MTWQQAQPRQLIYVMDKFYKFNELTLESQSLDLILGS